jgi:hypothetical protein
MNLSFAQLLAGGIAALLIYSAIKGKNPADVIKESLGQPHVTEAERAASVAAANTQVTQTVPYTGAARPLPGMTGNTP